MSGFDMFLIQYGLLAVFLLLFIKAIGVPIPIPMDIIVIAAATQVAQGKFVLWQAFLMLLLALTLGGLIQFWLVRGPGRGLLYRFGRYIGLTSARLDAASARVQKGGIIALSVAILVPGVRGAAIAASGLANFRLRTFLLGLVMGSAAFLLLHFGLGYIGGSLLTVIGHALPPMSVIILVLVLLVAVYLLWVVAVQRQKAARRELEGAATLEVLHEGICPVCLALYTAHQLRSLPLETGA